MNILTYGDIKNNISFVGENQNIMSDIKFGTDGWRAIIAEDYTVDNVKRVSVAVADYLLKLKDKPCVVIGHDCRFAGKMFSETTANAAASISLRAC